MNKFIFSLRNIRISFKKLCKAVSYFKGRDLIYIFNNSFCNLKAFKFINKLIKSSLFSMKDNYELINLKFEFFCNKSKIFKRTSYRAKGRCDIIKRRYSNLYLIIYY
ncbi:uL22m family ribosomal protein [Candidatus Vidania fulgoroideorum]